SYCCLEPLPRKPSWPAFMCERIHRPDIWMQRSDQNAARPLARRGPSTYGSSRFVKRLDFLRPHSGTSDGAISVHGSRVTTRPKSGGQVFSLHVEMILVKTLVVLGAKFSMQPIGSPAPFRAEKAGEFALKTVESTRVRAQLFARFAAARIALLPGTAAIFVKRLRATVFVANSHCPAEHFGSRIGHQEIPVIKLSPMRGWYFLFRIKPLLAGRSNVAMRAPLDDEIDLINFSFVQLPADMDAG